MRGADALIAALEARRGRHRLRHARRRQPAALRRAAGLRHPARADAPRGGRRPCRRGLRAGDRPRRGRLRHQRAGGDEPRHADLRRADGLDPDAVRHRPGADRAARHERLPGGGRDRDHGADRQALDRGRAARRRRAGDRRRAAPGARRAGPGRCSSTCPSTWPRARRGPTSTQPQLPGYRPRTKPNGKQVRIAARALAAARRPVLYAGGGVVHAGAAAELTALARLTGAPVTTTLMALGAFPASDPQWIGMLGMHGSRPPTGRWTRRT